MSGFVLARIADAARTSVPTIAPLASTPRAAGPLSASIVVCTLNRAPYLERLLIALKRQRRPHFEVLVVVGPCVDDTRDVLARRGAGVTILSCPLANLAMSRNIGWRAARGDVVFFIDDDAVPEPDWLDELIAPLEAGAAQAAGGPIRDNAGVAFQCQAQAVDDLARMTPLPDPGAPLPPGLTLAFTGASFCVERRALAAIGGFDEGFAYFLEETDLLRRLALAGARLAYVAQAEVIHSFAASSLREADRLPKDFSDILASVTRYCLKHHASENRAVAIADRVADRLLDTRRRIETLRARGALDGKEARRLWRTALAGVARAGVATLTSAQARALEAEGAPLPAFGRLEGPAPRRVGLVCAQSALGAACARMAAGLAELGHEVSFFAPDVGGAHVVEFVDGYWRHALPKGAQAFEQEARRVASRRRFETMICLGRPKSGAEWPAPVVGLEAEALSLDPADFLALALKS